MMSSGPNEILMILLGALGRQLPMLLVWAVVFVVALIKWSTHPRASMLTLMAVVVAFGSSVVASIAYPLLPRFMDMSDISWMYLVMSIFFSVLHGAAWLLLLGAVFSGRQPDFPVGKGGKKPISPPETSPFQS